MGASNISIEAIIQREPAPGGHDVDIILRTQRVREGVMNIAIEKIEALDVTCSPVTGIRV